jgi:CRISPR-associated protein Cas5
MKRIDLTILKKEPKFDKKATLIIEPLAPLSMVNDLPGSFYKSLKSPTKKMLCGLFENTLGWHISIAQRSLIQKDLKKLRRKQKIDFSEPQNGSTYIPLLMEYFDIELVVTPPSFHYNDLWSKAYRRSDAVVHPKGTMNLSYELIPVKREKTRDEKKPKQISSKELEGLFKENLGKFPLYYSSPTSREYVSFNGCIEVSILINTELLKSIKTALQYNNHLYLGNSEGWVNLKIETYEE